MKHTARHAPYRRLPTFCWILVAVVGSTDVALGWEVTPVSKLVFQGYSIRPTGLTVAGGALYFSAFSLESRTELWRYDGTSAQIVADINPNGSSNPDNLIAFQNNLYFVADDGTHGRELWRFDGSNAQMVQDLVPGSLHPNYRTGGAV